MEFLIATLDLAKEARRIDDWRLMDLLSHPKAAGSNPECRRDGRPLERCGRDPVPSVRTFVRLRRPGPHILPNGGQQR